MAPPLTLEDENNTTVMDSGGTIITCTQPTTSGKETAPTLPMDSFSNAPDTMSKVISTTGRNFDHSTSRDQRATTELESDKKDDVYVVIEDFKLNTVFSVISLTASLALAVTVFILAALLYEHKRKTKVSKPTKIELTKMRETTDSADVCN